MGSRTLTARRAVFACCHLERGQASVHSTWWESPALVPVCCISFCVEQMGEQRAARPLQGQCWWQELVLLRLALEWRTGSGRVALPAQPSLSDWDKLPAVFTLQSGEHQDVRGSGGCRVPAKA